MVRFTYMSTIAYEKLAKPTIVNRHIPHRFDVTEVLDKVSAAPLDEKVGIRHIQIEAGKRWGYHVAEVASVVNPHVHMKGLELYYVLRGKGKMHTGQVSPEEGDYVADWTNAIDAKEGDAFAIPGGYAHSLENTGKEPIVIMFRCPDDHLTDKDRFMVKNRPIYGQA